jgi:hypothetical protein
MARALMRATIVAAMLLPEEYVDLAARRISHLRGTDLGSDG